MWQVFYFIAVEREHERQRELERRRRLADVVRTPHDERRIGSVVRRGRALAGEAVGFVASVLDRPLVGPHHL